MQARLGPAETFWSLNQTTLGSESTSGLYYVSKEIPFVLNPWGFLFVLLATEEFIFHVSII